MRFNQLSKEEQEKLLREAETKIKPKVWDEQRKFVKAEVKEEYEQAQRELKKLRAEHLAKIRVKSEFEQELREEYGTFFFTNYDEVIKLFYNDGKFDGALAFKFMYLCSYSDYEGNLNWGNEYRGAYRGNMRGKDLEEVLGLTRANAHIVKKKLIALGALIEKEDNTLTVSKKLCIRGKLIGRNKQDSSRVFDDYIKELYVNSNVREHTRLGRFLLLLPYINVNHNVLCFNTAEKDPYKVQVLTIQDITTIMGSDVSHARRTQNDLLKSTVGGEPIFGIFHLWGSETFVVNPRVFYKGNDSDCLEPIANLFKMGRSVLAGI